MRKVKHFAGYGTVSMGRIKDGSATLHVRVEGNHERGIKVGEWDEYLLFNWIVSRFDKSLTFEQWHKKRPIIEIKTGYRDDPKEGFIDVCNYWFHY